MARGPRRTRGRGRARRRSPLQRRCASPRAATWPWSAAARPGSRPAIAAAESRRVRRGPGARARVRADDSGHGQRPLQLHERVAVRARARVGALQRPVVRRGDVRRRALATTCSRSSRSAAWPGPRRRAGVSTRSPDRRPRCARCCSRARRRAGVVLALAREVTCVERDGDGWRVTYEGWRARPRCRALRGALGGRRRGGSRARWDLHARRMSPCSARSHARRRRASRSQGSTGAGRTWSRGCCAAAPRWHARSARSCSGRYGLSGIVVFDLSRHARAGDVVALDLTRRLDRDRAQALVARGGRLRGRARPRDCGSARAGRPRTNALTCALL